jgi:hypothetical protein
MAVTRKRIDENAIITVLAEDNPKREGSAARARFDLYRDGMTVREAKANGLWATDIAYDSDPGRNFIQLTTPEGDDATPAPKAKRVKKDKAAKKVKAKAKKAKGKTAKTKRAKKVKQPEVEQPEGGPEAGLEAGVDPEANGPEGDAETDAIAAE